MIGAPPRAAALLVLALLIACEGRPEIVVSIGAIPAEARSLEVALSLDQEVFAAPPFSLLEHLGESRVTFAVRLPLQRGVLGIDAAVRDDRGCVVGLGSLSASLAAVPGTLSIDLQSSGPPSPPCDGGAPALTSATPSQSSTAGGGTVILRGWGLRPGCKVQLDGAPATDVLWRSPEEVSAVVPQRPGAHGPVQVLVVNPDGSRAGRGDLFSYYAREIRLAEPHAYLAGEDPVSIQLADLDGDGDLDAAVASRRNSQVFVLRNNGKGDFPYDNPEYVVAGAHPSALAVDDIDGDHRPDLLTANTVEQSVSVFVNGGAGPFVSKGRLYVGFDPALILATDLDADGRTDLVTGHPVSGKLSFLFNLGGLDFDQQSGPAGLDGMTGLVARDLNGDGRPDLAATRLAGEVVVLTSRSSGALVYDSSRITTGREPAALAIGDVSGDKNRDLVVIHGSADPALLLLGQGDGSFRVAPDGGPAGKRPSAVVLGDLDGDGRPDAVVADLGDDTVSVLRSEGTRLTRVASYSVPKAPASLAVGDLDGDGRLDIVVGLLGDDNTLGSVTVLFNRSE